MSETYIVIVFVPIPTPLTAWRGDPKGASHVFGPTLATRAWIGNTCSPFLFSYLPVKTLAKSLAAPSWPPPGAAGRESERHSDRQDGAKPPARREPRSPAAGAAKRWAEKYPPRGPGTARPVAPRPDARPATAGTPGHGARRQGARAAATPRPPGPPLRSARLPPAARTTRRTAAGTGRSHAWRRRRGCGQGALAAFRAVPPRCVPGAAGGRRRCGRAGGG